MDRFDVLNAVSKRKSKFVRAGINEADALIRAEADVSSEYHISLPAIKKLVG
jgi:hypothetical protein